MDYAQSAKKVQSPIRGGHPSQQHFLTSLSALSKKWLIVLACGYLANVTMKCLSWIQCNASRSIALPPSSFERAQKTGHFILRDHELILQGSARFHPDSVSNYILLIKLHMCWLIVAWGIRQRTIIKRSFPSYPGKVWAYQTLYDSEKAQWEESKTGWLLWDLKMVSHSSRRRGLATCQQLRNQGRISLPWLNLTITS